MYLDYLLPEDSGDEEVVLEILDAQGRLIRRFSSEAAGESMRVPSQAGMRAFELERVGTPRLEWTKGHHRFRWDFAMAGPWSADPRLSGRGGPWVPPGTYQARLSVGERTATRSFRVLIDPRLADDRVTALDLRQQNATAVAARDLLTRIRRLADDAATLGKEIDARLRATPSDGLRSSRERLTELGRRLTEDSSVRYPMPQLLEQAEYLYRLTRQSDQRLGRDVTERLEELRAAAATATAELAAITTSSRFPW
jgi:hypothetical protein